MEDILNSNHSFCGFYWIRSSGVPFFKWFATPYFEMKWNQEDLFFAGFFSALNSSGEVFFDGDILRYVEFEEFKIYSSKIQCNDIFVLITTKDCSDNLANTLLHNLTEFYFNSDISTLNPIENDSGEVEIKFLSLFEDILKQKEHLSNNHDIIRKSIPKLKKKKNIKKESNKTFEENLILKRKITELELKLGSISMMGRTIGHTLNNVLSSILGNVALAKLDAQKEDEQYESLTDAEKSCDRARDLTSRLLTISKNLSKNTEIYQKHTNIPDRNMLRTLTKEKMVLGKGRILLLDDEASLRHTTQKMISRLGYKVDTAARIEEALKLYQKSMKERKKYDAVILDLSELGGLGGFGALIWLKIDPNINAIVSSGYAKDPIFKDYTHHGFRGVLKKPYDIAQLSQVLNNVITQHHTTNPLP
ncbi:hypothetical protein NEF87_003905 [Candidatus Lokiarchaeum ossiferum]|uniref:Response regulatory domain-containing protein n=1 Tax=Candidatus Lokiarchaeum ossiferum TaxID=2951803 RepID=A0ABY6HVR1_9ARCH|nr:hypothetical protein NEF87_003905 [Candidatus Lokiarchaeum sp. B-35]